MTDDTASLIAALAATQDGIVLGAQLRELGVTRGEVRARCANRSWLRLQPDVYRVIADADEMAIRRSVIRAAFNAAGPDAVVVAETAAFWHGIGGLPPYDGIVHLAVDRSHPRPKRNGVIYHQLVIAPDEICNIGGVVVTTARRSVIDSILRVSRVCALCILDSALYLETIVADDLAAIEEAIAGRPGVRRVRPLISLADGRAQSPLESRVRLACIDIGATPDELQWPVYDASGVLLGFGDLAWFRKRRRPLIAEADGRDPHEQPEALFRDRRRANGFVTAGCDMIRFTWQDSLQPLVLGGSVLAALAA